MCETDITRKTRLKAIADFVQKVLPEPPSTRTESVAKKQTPTPRSFGVGTQTEAAAAAAPVAIPSTSAVYETTKPRISSEEIINDNDDDDNIIVEVDARASGREMVGPIASTYILLYL